MKKGGKRGYVNNCYIFNGNRIVFGHARATLSQHGKLLIFGCLHAVRLILRAWFWEAEMVPDRHRYDTDDLFLRLYHPSWARCCTG